MSPILIAYLFCFFFAGNASEECVYVDHIGKQFDIEKIGCPQNNVCNETRTITIRYIELPNYFYKEMKNEEYRREQISPHQKPVHQLLRRCCGTCANISQLDVLNNIGELTPETMKDADFIYPVFSKASRERMYGYYYLPLIDAPDMMYTTEPEKYSLVKLLIEVLPICIVAISLCVVAGFICWLLECRTNEEEFPSNFLIGWYEGFWWAFVSMTTVSMFIYFFFSFLFLILYSYRKILSSTLK